MLISTRPFASADQHEASRDALWALVYGTAPHDRFGDLHPAVMAEVLRNADAAADVPVHEDDDEDDRFSDEREEGDRL